MTKTLENRKFFWIATSVVALALGLALCAKAFAQNTTAPRVVAATEDMRLWSFGDCDRRFPYNATPEHKECVRVVGSPEATEARALHVCEVSHQADREEIDRCKAAYKANKERAAQEGVAANAPSAPAPQAPPSAEMMRRVKAITTAAVEEQRSATPPSAATETAAPAPEVTLPEESTWTGTLGMVALLAVVVGLGVNLLRRRQAQSA